MIIKNTPLYNVFDRLKDTAQRDKITLSKSEQEKLNLEIDPNKFYVPIHVTDKHEYEIKPLFKMIDLVKALPLMQYMFNFISISNLKNINDEYILEIKLYNNTIYISVLTANVIHYSENNEPKISWKSKSISIYGDSIINSKVTSFLQKKPMPLYVYNHFGFISQPNFIIETLSFYNPFIAEDLEETSYNFTWEQKLKSFSKKSLFLNRFKTAKFYPIDYNAGDLETWYIIFKSASILDSTTRTIINQTYNSSYREYSKYEVNLYGKIYKHTHLSNKDITTQALINIIYKNHYNTLNTFNAKKLKTKRLLDVCLMQLYLNKKISLPYIGSKDYNTLTNLLDYDYEKYKNLISNKKIRKSDYFNTQDLKEISNIKEIIPTKQDLILHIVKSEYFSPDIYADIIDQKKKKDNLIVLRLEKSILVLKRKNSKFEIIKTYGSSPLNVWNKYKKIKKIIDNL